jgi:chlorosome envelope protein I
MNVIINDKPCTASVGQSLGKAARLNHSHVGYVCGGHGICQACYVTVQEGAGCLSPLTDVEKAFLSERQIESGGRLACQATIEKEGSVRVLSRPEEVRRMLFSNPVALFAYGAQMGRDVSGRIIPGIVNIIGRAQRGELGGREAFGDLLEAAGAGFQFAVETVPQMIPFRDQIMGLIGSLPLRLPFLPAQPAAGKPEVISLKISAPAAHAPMQIAETEVRPRKAENTSLEGIAEEHAVRLVKAGVRTLDLLLERGRERKGRKELSDTTGISEKEILTLVNRADLARINGIGIHFADLLECAGVDTLPELAQRNAEHLHAKLREVNTRKNMVKQLPSPAQVSEWVAEAKTLPRMVNY